MEGRVIKERYRLQEQLGHGGMGSVWRAEDLTLHIDVAVKLIESTFAASAEARVRFQREALAAAQLRSMHIVLITDHGVDGDTPYIVMELLRGESLAARLQRRTVLSFDETLSIFSQIAEALAFAHERRIVHRDLKPDNVFIVSERTKELVKVLDFGVAKRLDTESYGNKLKTHTGTLLGTPYYMSPEQTRASADIDHRADIWSFGVLVHECITGKRPFDAETLPDLLMSICRDPIFAPSKVARVPRGFDDWFARAAARDVSERFQSIEVAMDALRALQGETLVGAWAAPASAPTAQAGTVRVEQNVPIPTVAVPPLRVPSELSPNTVIPSSVTSPGFYKARGSKVAVGGVISALIVAGALLGYGLWHRSGRVASKADVFAATQRDETIPANLQTRVVAATPAISTTAAAPDPPIASSATTRPAPDIAPVTSALEVSKAERADPTTMAPAPAATRPPVARPPVARPRSNASSSKPFGGGF